MTYEGFDTAKLFAAVYGDQWNEIDEVLFTCAFASHPNPDALVEDVLAYLETMAQHKQKPKWRASDE